MAMTRDIEALIDGYAREQFREQEPGCALLVVRGDDTLFRGAYGMAHLELDVPMRPELRFRLASLTKQFVAVAVLKLRDAGALSLEDDFRRWLPEWRMTAQPITLAHMLRHTSGLKTYEEPSNQQLLAAHVTATSVYDMVRLAKDDEPEHAPDERYTYNNYAYMLLGLVIERAADRPLEEYLREALFVPADMHATEFDDLTRLLPGRVEGYQLGPGGVERAPYINMRVVGGAGGLIAPIDDLGRWYGALHRGLILKQPSLEEAWRDHQLRNGEWTGYGYGWGLGSYDGERFVQHGGQIYGFYNHAVFFPDQGLAAVVLSNLLPNFPEPEWLSLRAALAALGKPYREPEPVMISPMTFKRLEGVYTSGRMRAVVRVSHDRVWAKVGIFPWRELIPIADDTFALPRSFHRYTAVGETLVATDVLGGRPVVWQRSAEPLPEAEQLPS